MMTWLSTWIWTIVAVIVAAAVGGTWWLVGTVVYELSWTELGWFLLVAMLTERLAVRQPGGQSVPISLAVLGTAAILGASPMIVTVIAGSSWLFGRLFDRGGFPIGELVGRLAGAWALAGFAALGAAILPASWDPSEPGVTISLSVGAALAVGSAIVVGLPAAEALARTQGRWHYPLRRVRDGIVATRLVGPAVAATAGLGALVHPVLGVWTLPTMLIPLLAARVGLERLFVADRAYEQTIRAMSRLPEHLESGSQRQLGADHGVRVGALAREVAHELGLSEVDTTEVVRAAHLHELGRLKLEVSGSVSRRQLASAGGAAVRMVSSQLERVARIIESSGDLPTSSSATTKVHDVRVQARIVAACCEIDRYSPDPIEPRQLDEVVVRLVRDIGDLEVVGALTRVLTRPVAVTR